MWRRVGLVLVALMVPGVTQAQDKLDHLLPAGSQIYIHWDGVEAHKADADKLAVMKMWKGETGDFIRGLWKYIEVVGKEAATPEIGAEMAGAVFDEFGGLLKTIGNKGVSVGFELQAIEPFKMQLTLAFPNGGGKAKSPLSFMTTMSKLDKENKIKNVKHGDRHIHFTQVDRFYFAWWAEGKDAIWSVGTTEPVALIKEMEKNKDGLGGNNLYKEVHGFKEFPIWSRGYFDMASLLNVAGKAAPIVGKVSETLGLDSIKSIAFYSGFDGPAERAVTLTNLAKGPKKGIMKAISGKTFTLNDLPPMPADLRGFSAGTVDWTGAYDTTVDFVDLLLNQLPFGMQDVKQAIKYFEKNNNVDVGAVIKSLDHLYASYSAAAEGPLGFGQTQLLKVKDEKKLDTELTKLLKLAEKESNGIVKLTSQKYHGAALHNLAFVQPGTDTEVSSLWFTIHKGWLAMANYPQPLKGYVLRANGDLPTWKASAEVTARLKPFPTEFASISIDDPRPTVKLVLSVLPPLVQIGQIALDQAAMGNLKLPGKKFDISLIPNAYEATRHLFPNVTVTTIDGNTIRAESRSSLMLPF